MLFTSIYPQASSAFDPSASNPKEGANIRFPSDIQAVISSKRPNYGHLYIGNIESAENLPLLTSLNIGAILSVAKERLPLYPKQQIRYHKHVPIDDQDADIHPYVHESVAFIAEKLLFTNVLVQCINGVNRSACFVIAYLMKQRKMDLDLAFKEVKSKRRLLQLSRSMLEQLRKYQTDLMNLASSKRKYSFSIRVDSQADISSISPSYFRQNTENDGSLLPELYAKEDRILEEKEHSKIERISSVGKSSRKNSLSKEENWQIDTYNPEKVLKANEQTDSKGSLSRKRSNSREQFNKTPSKTQKRGEQLSDMFLQVRQKQEKEQKASKIAFRRPSQRSYQPQQLQGGVIQPDLFTGLQQ